MKRGTAVLAPRGTQEVAAPREHPDAAHINEKEEP
jgi:hypothetical protein